MYKKIKKQNGEKFAQTLRNFHNGILEIEGLDTILRHAGRGREDAKSLLPYLMSLLAANDNMSADTPAPAPGDPFALLDQAGYEAFHADTLEKQNSIKRYFKKDELLCTFNDSARYKRYHMVHAIKKDVDQIRRKDFTGREKREDAYGTSVISIQMLKSGGFISIKNRYNHTVSGCDNTFGSNPDNIIQGLSAALKDHFNVEFVATKSPLPENFTLIGNQVFKYHQEFNNIYYGDQVWARNGTNHTVDKSAGDALVEGFLFDNKTRTLQKIDPGFIDSFADDFNRDYGGNSGLHVKNGDLYLDDELLVGAEQSRIKTLHLSALTTMGDGCLHSANALTDFEAPALTTMGYFCLSNAHALTDFEAPALTTMGYFCLSNAHALTDFEALALTTMGYFCLCNAPALTHFEAPALTTMDDFCLSNVNALTDFEAPALTTMGGYCLSNANALTRFEAPALTTMGGRCLSNVPVFTKIKRQARAALRTLRF